MTKTTTGLTPKRLYLILSIAEACTWTLLIAALIVRASAGVDPAALFIVGGLRQPLPLAGFGIQQV